MEKIRNPVLYWLMLLLPLAGQLVLSLRFYMIGEIGYAILTLAVFLLFGYTAFFICRK